MTDSRDLAERRDELKQEILDSFLDTFEHYAEQTEEFEDILFEEEEIESWKADWQKELDEIKNLENLDVYCDDIMYLPIQYHKNVVKQPYFKGRGELNVTQMEDLLEKFQEYVHQQAVIKQKLKEIVVDLKFNTSLTT